MNSQRIVAGLDVHKDSIYLCILSPRCEILYENKFGVLTTQLREMRDIMLQYGVSEAAMESTGVYWIPVWNELVDAMDAKLVNPYFIKQLPGRKSDVKDAQWIAECLLEKSYTWEFCALPHLFRTYER